MSAEDSSELVVRTNWIRSAAWLWVPALAASLTLGALEVLVSRVPIGSSLPFLFGLAAIAFAGFGLALQFAWVREIHVSNGGVMFLIGRRRLQVGWADLEPPPIPLLLTIPFAYRRNGVVQRSDGLPVSKKQAIAILTHPSCPPFSLKAEVRRSLGLSQLSLR
jgi:hypothetical protein